MKIGRNDPCPCGSGKKYKKCCLNKPSQVHKFKHDISIVYAGIKNINSQLIKKSNDLPYASASLLSTFSQLHKTVGCKMWIVTSYLQYSP